jgi:three-Cys-motif partner protein
MATGAGDQYWEQQMLPSVLKHDLLRRYLPRFAGKTGSRGADVVYLDGYAGRGRYADGSRASAEQILQVAENQRALGINYDLFFYEPSSDSYPVLKAVVDEYVARGVHAEAEKSEVIGALDRVVEASQGKPLFLFFDPCGLGIPFSVLVKTLTGPRAATWPPTEILLNFSLEAVRRIAGHVTSPKPNEQTMARLDVALGGSWWRSIVRDGVTEQAVNEIVDGFMQRLARDVGMRLFAIPVRRSPTQKPIYHLVFGTRKSLGLWHFADDTARATDKWWDALAAQEKAKYDAIGQDSLFGNSPVRAGPSLAGVEAQARPRIAENIARLVALHGRCRVGDYPAEVFGEYLGRVREPIVRAAIKELHASGRTPSNGIGSPITSLVVSPPH